MAIEAGGGEEKMKRVRNLTPGTTVHTKSKERDLRILGGVKGAGLQKPALFTPDQ